MMIIVVHTRLYCCRCWDWLGSFTSSRAHPKQREVREALIERLLLHDHGHHHPPRPNGEEPGYEAHATQTLLRCIQDALLFVQRNPNDVSGD